MTARPRTTVVAATLVLAAATRAGAEPLRLRGDALAQAQSPAGLLVLQGQDGLRPWLRAEGLVWLGAGVGHENDEEANALVIALRAVDPRQRGALTLGRQVVVAGGLRPVHLDGLYGVARLPYRTGVEAFGGSPIAAGAGGRAWDWVLGARAFAAPRGGRIGLAWTERRDGGELSGHEIAVDAAARPHGVDVAGAASWSLAVPGLAMLDVSAAWARGDGRLEAFASHRTPSRLLPATSLFTVLGDTSSQRVGVSGRWHATPRLDLRATLAGHREEYELGLEVGADARLLLDAEGRGVATLELRRMDAPGGGWTGARGSARVDVGPRLGASTELELVVPDEPDGRGVVWPWGLVALSYRPAPGWDVAAALEASSTPEYVWRVDALARLTRAWGAR